MSRHLFHLTSRLRNQLESIISYLNTDILIIEMPGKKYARKYLISKANVTRDIRRERRERAKIEVESFCVNLEHIPAKAWLEFYDIKDTKNLSDFYVRYGVDGNLVRLCGDSLLEERQKFGSIVEKALDKRLESEDVDWINLKLRSYPVEERSSLEVSQDEGQISCSMRTERQANLLGLIYRQFAQALSDGRVGRCEECGNPYVYGRRGTPQRFCSSRCRWRAKDMK